MEGEVKTEPLETGKRRLSLKAVGIIVGILAVIALVLLGVFTWMQWNNDGARYAERLSEQIGVSPETAQKYAHLTLDNASKFACVNLAAEDYAYIYESKQTVEVSGVTVPQWVIYLKEDDKILTNVEFYNYVQLDTYGTGVKTSAHVEKNGIILGMTPEEVQQYTGFAPLCRSYSNKGMREAYKYYYKDENTGNTVSYILYVNYEEGQAVSASEKENQFILPLLMLG